LLNCHPAKLSGSNAGVAACSAVAARKVGDVTESVASDSKAAITIELDSFIKKAGSVNSFRSS
jgi:hypothetical protein